MDLRPRVSISTTKSDPTTYLRTLSSSSSAGSLPIRAPLTIDDGDSDFESNSGETMSVRTSSYASDSDGELGTEGFISGEEFVNASDRPFVIDPDEGNLGENVVVNRYKLSRPYVAHSDEETSNNFTVDKEESDGAYEHDSVVELGLVEGNSNSNLTIPIARLSMEDDESDGLVGIEGVVGEVEDGGSSGFIKVPGIDNVPVINALGVEGREEESLDMRVSVIANKPELLFAGVDGWAFNSQRETMLVKDFDDPLSTESNDYKSFGSTTEAHVESSTGSKKDIVEENSDNGIGHSFEEGLELGNMEEERIQQNSNKEHEIEEKSQPQWLCETNNKRLAAEVTVEAGDLTHCQNNDCGGVDFNEMSASDQGCNGEKLVDEFEPDPDVRDKMQILLTSSKAELIDNAIEGNGIQMVDSSDFSQPNPNQESMHSGKLESEDRFLSNPDSVMFVAPSLIWDQEVKMQADNEANHDSGKVGEGASLSDEDLGNFLSGDSVEMTQEITNTLAQSLAESSHQEEECSGNQSQGIDGWMAWSAEEADTEKDGEELFDSAVFAANLKAATGAELDGGGLTIPSADGSSVYTLGQPAEAASSLSSLRHAPPPKAAKDESKENLTKEGEERLEKIQFTTVKFLRLVQRLGQSPDDFTVTEVLHRLAVASGRHSIQALSLESAKRVAMQLEAEPKDELDFSVNILVLGKTGVGKSATINTIFGEVKTAIGSFEPATATVKEIVGTIDGVKVRILDTPGLRSSVLEERTNQKIFASIKKYMRKFPPDVVLYVDRLDMHTRDFTDLWLLRSLTSSLGPSIWHNTIVTLTHAASNAPDGPSGSPISYELFVAQRSQVLQQAISLAVGNVRLMSLSMLHPVSLIDNHLSCQKNRNGESLLLTGQSWRLQLLLLCYSVKILSEVDFISKSHDPFHQKNLLGMQLRSPPLPYLLSSLLQSRTHPKLSAVQGGDGVDSDLELENFSDSNSEDEDEYDQLPPFKPLRRSKVAELSKEQRKVYFEEYEYRVKLLQKKQWREEVKRLREMEKVQDSGNNNGDIGEEGDHKDGSPETVRVPLPDVVLPPSFDGENPAYRYRFLESTSQTLVRPVLDSHGWDNDCGYDGVNIERNLAIAGRFPGAFALQITKDKKEFNIQLNSSVSAKHGEDGSTMAGFDIQTLGTQLAYILRAENKFKSFKVSKTTAGLSITLLGENLATGLKLQDQIAIGKCLVLAGSAGAVRSQVDTAYGLNLEVRLKDKNFPVEQDGSTLGLSMVQWKGDLGFLASLQSQFSIGQSSKMSVRFGMSNKRNVQISLKVSSSKQLQIALIGILPMAVSIFRSFYPGSAMKSPKY